MNKIMTDKEYKIWRIEQRKKLFIPRKKVKSRKFMYDRMARTSRKIAKYGIFKTRGILHGSFESSSQIPNAIKVDDPLKRGT